MLVLLLLAARHYFGRSRQSALEVLSRSKEARAVRKAESSWRSGWTKSGTVPPVNETLIAIRALGAVRDGDRLKGLVRSLSRHEDDHTAWSSAAISALAVSGEREEALRLLDSNGGDDVANAVVAATEDSATTSRLLEMQRFGHLDLHGLSPTQVERLLKFLFDSALEIDGLSVVPGKGRHSSSNNGTSPVKAKMIQVVDSYPSLSLEPVENNLGAFVLRVAS